MNYKTVYLECGKYKFRVGEDDVVEIGLSAEQPGMWVIKKGSGDIAILAPNDTFLALQQEQNIVVPSVSLSDVPAA